MPTPATSSVFRYFERADSFVEVRRVAEDLCTPSAGSLDRQGYQRMVVELCLAGRDDGLVEDLEELFPEDAEAACQALYELCITVNPQLDIQRVGLRTAAPEDSEPSQGVGSPTEQLSADVNPEVALDESSFLARLKARSHQLERKLGARVVGQPAAVRSIVRAVRKAAAGLAEDDRPLATLLWTGRTGTGKTLLAKALADELFGREAAGTSREPVGTGRALVRIDCSEFASPHESARLVGAPPGYVGHERGGQLTEALAGAAPRVVLFDEIEKADGKLHDLLLQILEEGSLTDGRGERASFRRSIVILTSNAGAQEWGRAESALGFGSSAPLTPSQRNEVGVDALRQRFAPELLGRLDEIVVFDPLDGRAANEIARRELAGLALRARRQGPIVAFTSGVARWVAQQGFDPHSGAREIRRVIQRSIEGPLSECLLGLEQETKPSPAFPLIRCRIRAGRPHFRIEP